MNSAGMDSHSESSANFIPLRAAGGARGNIMPPRTNVHHEHSRRHVPAFKRCAWRFACPRRRRPHAKVGGLNQQGTTVEDSELAYLSAAEQGRLIRNRKLSPVELVQCSLAR